MNFFKKAADRIRDERMSNVGPYIQDLAKRGNVTWGEYTQLTMNSWEREYLYPHLTDKALVLLIRDTYLPNCSPESRPSRPCIPYDESLINNLMPLLLDRFEKLMNEKEEKTQ